MNTFYDQYSNEKIQALNAIKHEQNVVLWGSGANGKTYLIRELVNNNDLNMDVYERLFENDVVNDNILQKKLWIECTDINYPLSNINESYVVINMNKFKHPDYCNSRFANL